MIKRFFKNENGNGFTGLFELIGFSMLFVMLSLIMISMILTFNSLNGLAYAKQTAARQGQVAGGLTPQIVQDITSILTVANYNVSSISVTSPQSTPVAYGGQIEINIVATTNQLIRMDSNGNPVYKTHTFQPKIKFLSQYQP